MGTFTVTANSSTSVTASGSWAMTYVEISNYGGSECTHTYLRIYYKLSSSGSYSTFATGNSWTGVNTVTVSHTNTSMSANTTYNFRLTQFYTLIDEGDNL